MTLLEDLERHSEDKETTDPDILKTVLDDPELPMPEWSGTEGNLPHPGSTREPGRLVFLSESFVA
jgi:hypothetical protein